MSISKLFKDWLSHKSSHKPDRLEEIKQRRSKWEPTKPSSLLDDINKDMARHKRLLKELREKSTPVIKKSSVSLSNAGISGIPRGVNFPTGGSSVTNSTVNNQGALIVDHENQKITMNSRLEVNGRDILKELDEMRDSLLLLKRDVNMEEKYPKLKEIKDQYERELAKYKTFEALK